MQKDFDGWNNEKKIVDKKSINRDLYFYPKEIWWCSAGLNIGVESNGKNENFERPMLIMKKFNNEMIWVLPMTTQAKENKYHYKLEHEAIKSYVVISQIKTISTKRLLRKVGTISEGDFINIKKKIKDLM